MPPPVSYSGSFRAVDLRQAANLLRLIALCLVAASPFAVDPIAYMCITIPVLVAPFLWVSSGAFGIPVLPVISALSYLYYALPLLSGNTLAVYRPEDLVWAALSVGLFLTAASLAAWPFMGDGRGRNKIADHPSAGQGPPYQDKVGEQPRHERRAVSSDLYRSRRRHPVLYGDSFRRRELSRNDNRRRSFGRRHIDVARLLFDGLCPRRGLVDRPTMVRRACRLSFGHGALDERPVSCRRRDQYCRGLARLRAGGKANSLDHAGIGFRDLEHSQRRQIQYTK